MRGCSLSAWDSCHQAWDRVTLLSEPREPCWELHPSPQWARSKCGPACPICWHQCHVLGSLPRARQPPQHSTACTGTRPGSQCCPRPALQVCPQRCPWGSATSTCSCWVKQSQRLGKQGRKTHPSLTCLDLLYSTPFFLVHAPCHRAASCKVAGNLISPWRSTITCCCSRRSTLIPLGAEQIPDRHRVSTRMSVFPD